MMHLAGATAVPRAIAPVFRAGRTCATDYRRLTVFRSGTTVPQKGTSTYAERFRG
jgi:hypothetical protein